MNIRTFEVVSESGRITVKLPMDAAIVTNGVKHPAVFDHPGVVKAGRKRIRQWAKAVKKLPEWLAEERLYEVAETQPIGDTGESVRFFPA